LVMIDFYYVSTLPLRHHQLSTSCSCQGLAVAYIAYMLGALLKPITDVSIQSSDHTQWLKLEW